MDILGKRLVRSLLVCKDLAGVTDSGISEVDLFDDGRTVFLWVLDYVSAKADWPTALMVEESTGVSLPEELDPLEYICDQIRKRSLGRSVEGHLKRAAEKLEARDPDEAMTIIMDASLKFKSKRVGAKVDSYRASGLKRFDAYKAVKDVHGLIGIHTPWKSLDVVMQGWVNGTLNVITAAQNTGKTWFLVIVADHCLTLGSKVLFVTMEMASNRIQRRIDSVRYKLPFGDLRDASLDIVTEERFATSLTEDISGVGDIILADKKIVRTVGDVQALVIEYKPDIVIIDGGYRFQGTGKSSWDATVNIVTDLQIAAEMTDIPWIVSTQQGDANETGKEVKRGPHMRAWNIRYGKEWVINPDNVIGLYQNEDLRLIKMMEVHFLKTREVGDDRHCDSFKINWRRREMDFTEIDALSPAGSSTITVGEEGSGIDF